MIDDGSTDGSLQELEAFVSSNPCFFFLASVAPNASKVGALCMTTSSITHEYIILSDFDTDIFGIHLLNSSVEKLQNDTSLMGCYFRMLPYGGVGNVLLFQQLEYCLQRSIYKFHQKEKSIRVMPGAASFYKRKVLNSIYSQHSGLRSGEDREATLIGLKLGYKTFYFDDILAMTRPPQSFNALIKQRIRWNLGYLETFVKERRYYFYEMGRLSKVGVITFMDILVVLFMVLCPFIVFGLAISGLKFLLVFVAVLYIIYISWVLNLLLLSPEESKEIKRNRSQSIFLFPFFKISVDYISWMGAIIRCVKKNIYSTKGSDRKKFYTEPK